MSFGRIVDELRDFPDYLDTTFHFVLFGLNGTGDWYAFCYKFETDGDVSIVFIYHDDEKAVILAKNFDDFIFRKLVEFAVQLDLKHCDEQQYRAALSAMLESHRKYLGGERYAFIKTIYQRPLGGHTNRVSEHYSYDYLGLVSYEKFQDILRKNIKFDRLDEEFAYQVN